MRSISQQAFSEALQRLCKDIRSVKCTGQNQGTLDTANHFFGESLGFLWLASSPFQRSCKRVDPGGEVIADSVGKAIALISKCEYSNETDTAAGEEVTTHIVEHGRDALYGI